VVPALKRTRPSRSSPCLLAGLGLVLASGCTAGRDHAPPSQTHVPAPVNVQAAAISPYHAGIGWEDRSNGKASFLLQRRRGGGGWETRLELPAGSTYALDLGLEPETSYAYRVGALAGAAQARFSEDVSLETPFSHLPEAEVERHEPGLMQPGVTVLSIEDPDYIAEFAALAAVDDEGRPLWMIGDERFFVITDFDFFPGGNLLLMSGSAMEEVTLSGERLWRYDAALFHHDIDVTPWGTTIGIMAYGEMLVPGTLYSCDGVLEYDPASGREAGAWPLKEIVSPADLCILCFYGEEYFFGHDWTHANALIFDPDMEHFYLSVRNLNRIYKISLRSGSIDWIMGDGGDFGQGLFSHQHDPQLLPGNRMLVFDNGLHREGDEDLYSRVVEIEYDPEARAAAIVWEYRETPDFYTSIGGDADRLPNGNTLVTDSMNGRVVEVTPAGERVWEYRLPFPFRIYKAVRVPGN
jgi:hypothetical protein